MPRFRQVDATVMTQQRKRTAGPRPLSPEMQRIVSKIRTITDESVVYEVSLTADEKPATVRQQLLRAAKVAGVEIAVRKSESGYYIGLMTAERRSNRGRKRAATA